VILPVAGKKQADILSHTPSTIEMNETPSPSTTPDAFPPQRITIAGSLIAAAAVVVILAGLKAAQMIVAPFLLAAFFAIVLIPPLRWLKSQGFSDAMAFSVISGSVLIVGIVMIWILTKSTTMFITKLPDYQTQVTITLATIDDTLEPYGLSLLGGTKMPETAKGAKEANGVTGMSPLLPNEPMESSAKPLEKKEEEVAGETEEEDGESEVEDARPLREFTPPDPPALDLSPVNTIGIITFIQRGVMELCMLIGIAVLVLVMLVFMILEASRMPQKLLDAFGSKGITNDHLKKIAEEIWSYILIKGMISFFTGLFTWLFLWFMGIEYAALWGIMAFFFNFIPNLGPIISSAPPIALALFDQGFGVCLIVTGGLIAINWIGGYYYEPKYLGDGLGISPLVVLLSLLFWGWIFGVIGMFLSAPLTMVVKIVVNSFDDTKWVSRLMDG